jgi:hypothetical protein
VEGGGDIEVVKEDSVRELFGDSSGGGLEGGRGRRDRRQEPSQARGSGYGEGKLVRFQAPQEFVHDFLETDRQSGQTSGGRRWLTSLWIGPDQKGPPI